MTGYTIDVDGDVLVFEVQAELDADDFASAFDDVVDRADRAGVTAVVSHVTTDDPYGVETFREWEEAASRAADVGVVRWAVVAEGTKKLSLRSQVSEAQLDVYGSEDVDEAISWARG